MSNVHNTAHQTVSQQEPSQSVRPGDAGARGSLEFKLASALMMVLPVVAAALVASPVLTWSSGIAIAIILILTAMMARAHWPDDAPVQDRRPQPRPADRTDHQPAGWTPGARHQAA